MDAPVATTFRLVPRGRAGLACDEEGVALGPVGLVELFRDTDGWLRFRARPADEVDAALKLAYGSRLGGFLARRRRSLTHIAELLSAGEAARAKMHAALLGFPDIDDKGMAKLRGLSDAQSGDEAGRGAIEMRGAHARRPALHQDEQDRRGRMRDRSRRRERESDPRESPLRSSDS